MKKIILIFVVITILGGGIWILTKSKRSDPQLNAAPQCQIKEITFYYLDQCEWCNKVKGEGTISKIEALGIRINKINAAIGPVKHKFTGVPAFAINGQVYEGYRTFEELQNLLGCPLQNNQTLGSQNKNSNYSTPPAPSKSPQADNGNVVLPNKGTANNQDQIAGDQYQGQNPTQSPPQPSIPNNQNEGTKTETIPPPTPTKQIIKMDASSSGYEPNYFKLKAGIPVRWEITDTGTSGCTNAIIANGLFSGQISLTPGQVSVKEFTPTTPGKYQFSCWMGMISGMIVVESQ